MGQVPEVTQLSNSGTVKVEQASQRTAAFIRLTESHLDSAYRLARAILHDPGEAEDATHDAFEQAWRKLPTLRDPELLERWFDRILVNTCRNRLRQNTRRQTKDISAELALTGKNDFDGTNDRDVLGTAIATLSVDHRVVVALRYYLDLSVEEIARRLDIPIGTAQSRLHYALKGLHETIDAADTKGTIR